MRYAIFSDVHSNLEAFSAVLDFYKNQRVDKFIFLGDVVGYGADPVESLEFLKGLSAVCICGNHDLAMIDKFDLSYFNPNAIAAINWTKPRLNDEAKAYLGSLPLIYEGENFTCVHGSLDQPLEFNYVKTSDDAAKNFMLLKKNILFVGHSHYQWVCESSGDLITENTDGHITLSSRSRYIVNVGSVVQPRDGDWRPPACIYDTDNNLISFTRIAYDVESAAKKIVESGLPSILATRLFKGE